MDNTELAQKELLCSIIELYKKWYSSSKVLKYVSNIEELDEESIEEIFECLLVENCNLLCFCSGMEVDNFFSNECNNMCNAGAVGLNYLCNVLRVDRREE